MTALVPDTSESIIDSQQQILVTGGTGFIGRRLLRTLQDLGFKNVRCLVRSSAGFDSLDYFNKGDNGSRIEFLRGNLLSREDCKAATHNAAVVYHLAAGTGSKSFADAFMNSVVTTRNLIESVLEQGCLRRFVNVSSFSVYSNLEKPGGDILDETCPMEERPELRGDAYCFAKTEQDRLVMDYGRRHDLPYVLVRPGVVYGPGKDKIHGRIGIEPFGFFLHLGGSNPIPFTFVDNCAEAIALAGIKRGIDGQVLNVVDDNLLSSRQFLSRYKKEVHSFHSVYVPHLVSYLLCLLWEKYSLWSQGQLPPLYNRRTWAAFWKHTRYSNAKTKEMLDWTPKVSMTEGLTLLFAYCRERMRDA